MSDDEGEYETMLPLMDEDKESGEEYAIDEQVGLGLIVRRALTTQFKDEEAQHENIFYIQCLIKDKVCSLIIDR